MKTLSLIIKYIVCIIVYIIAGYLIGGSVGYGGTNGVKVVEPLAAMLGIGLLTIMTCILRNVVINRTGQYFIALYGISLLCFGCYVTYWTKKIVFDSTDASGSRYDICALMWFLISLHIILSSIMSIYWKQQVTTLKQLLFFKQGKIEKAK